MASRIDTNFHNSRDGLGRDFLRLESQIFRRLVLRSGATFTPILHEIPLFRSNHNQIRRCKMPYKNSKQDQSFLSWACGHY